MWIFPDVSFSGVKASILFLDIFVFLDKNLRQVNSYHWKHLGRQLFVEMFGMKEACFEFNDSSCRIFPSSCESLVAINFCSNLVQNNVQKDHAPKVKTNTSQKYYLAKTSRFQDASVSPGFACTFFFGSGNPPYFSPFLFRCYSEGEHPNTQS